MGMGTNESGWWTFHGDPARTGCAAGSRIKASNVAQLKRLHSVQVGGPVLSVPAVTGGFVYVGTANGAVGNSQPRSSEGGSLHKISLESGQIVATFRWATDRTEGDVHGFTGMGCTPAVTGGRVYFSAFNGKIYCLDAATLTQIWVTDLRRPDPGQNQPISNVAKNPVDDPQAEGWCSPLVVNGRVYVGIGEGENPDLYAFVFCLDAASGQVVWIFCTNRFDASVHNEPNVLPADVLQGRPAPRGFRVFSDPVPIRGCVVWSAISYDADLDRIFCTTGNPAPESSNGSQPALPAPGYAYGVLSLDAKTGGGVMFYQIPPESSYRPSDIDVDFGASATIFTLEGRKVLTAGCKNGGFFKLDAATLEEIAWRQLLPRTNSGGQIETVDPHGPDDPTNPTPRVSNDASNSQQAENFHGTYSTAAFDPVTGRLFMGIGGNNYHYVAAGIDSDTTPFLRAMNAGGALDDAWELDGGDPRRYVKPRPPMYTTPGEAGLSSPAVVNDVVFCSTSKISLYAFAIADGTMLWSDTLGSQTGGFLGGYGYCLGPAVCGDYVVAGALYYGGEGGALNIYALPAS